MTESNEDAARRLARALFGDPEPANDPPSPPKNELAAGRPATGLFAQTTEGTL